MKRIPRYFTFIILLLGIIALTISVIGAEGEETEIRKPSVAIVDFKDKSGQHLDDIGDASVEILGTLLYQTDKFDVVERDKMEAIITEQGLSMSGLVDSEKSSVQVGKLLGADYIITGAVVSFTSQKVNFKGYGVETSKIVHELGVNVKILNISTGKIEFASLFTAKKEILNTATSTEIEGLERILLNDALKSAVAELVKKIDAKNLQNAEKVTVNFDSDPDGADVEIDGVFYGNTPCSVTLKPGIHEVVISLGGYEPWSKKVNAVDGLTLKATLAQKTGK
ncbi:MAG TPA: CsgG/HfaB family protein [Bacillota bacterium]|nr:CsgG/HfaB family protein [Bacillota bacterium]